jgi:hypothetical protein
MNYHHEAEEECLRTTLRILVVLVVGSGQLDCLRHRFVPVESGRRIEYVS